MNIRYTKGARFLAKMVYKRVRGWTSGRSSPVSNLFECPTGPIAVPLNVTNKPIWRDLTNVTELFKVKKREIT